MGRPIKKSFFANLSNPYQDQATGGPTGEGGEGVDSVTIDTVGSYTSALPTVTFGIPDLNLGVQATGIVHGKALSAVATAAGSGYAYNNVLTQANGATGTYATWTVTALKTDGVTINNAGTATDTGDKFRFSGSYAGGSWTTPLEILVTSDNGSGSMTGFTVTQAGVWTGSSAPTTTVGATKTQIAAGQDYNSAGVQFNLTSYGVAAVAVATEGDYTAITSGAKATSVSPAGGTGATLTITYGVKSVEITDPGSHYISVADASVTFSLGSAAGTSVLTDSNDQGIAAYAYIIDGTEGSIVDIMKQESSHRYLVKERNGTQGQCKLVASPAGSLYPGEMCILATDTTGSSYFVTKLTAHRANLTRYQSAGSGWVFNDGDVAGWTIDAASTGVVSVATV